MTVALATRVDAAAGPHASREAATRVVTALGLPEALGARIAQGAADAAWRVLEAHESALLVFSTEPDAAPTRLRLALRGGARRVPAHAVEGGIAPPAGAADEVKVDPASRAGVAIDMAWPLPGGAKPAAVDGALDLAARALLEMDVERERDRRRVLETEEMLAVVAHDLRGPLGTLSNALDALRAGQPRPEDVVASLGVVERGVATALRVVTDLEHLSRADGGTPGGPTPLTPASIGEAAASAARALAEHRGVVVSVQPRSPMAPIRGDSERLVHALSNVLLAAIEHAPKGSEVFVRVSGVEGGGVTYEVEDRGVAVPADELGGLFDRASCQGPRRRGRRLALVVAREIVQAHGGRIACESREGSTIFRVTLPA